MSCAFTVYFEDELTRISSDLNEKDNILQTFIELAPVGIILFQDEKIKLVNNSLSQISGYDISEMRNWTTKNILDAFESEDRKKVEYAITRSLNRSNDESKDNFIATFFTKSKQSKLGEFYIKTTKFQGKRSNFVIVIDITERIKLEEKFKLAFLNSPNPIVLVDAKTDRFIIFNEQFSEMFGYSTEAMYNLTFEDLSLPEDLVIQEKSYPNERTHKEGFKLRMNKKYRKRDGLIIETVVSTSYINISDENQYFITQLVDISYLNEIEYYKNLNNSLEEANNELKSLSQIVSHDVKAPLNAITNLINLIEQDYSKVIPEDLMKLFNQINKKIYYTSELVKSILEYSGVGFFEETPELLDSKILIKNIINLLDIPAKFTITIKENIPKLKLSKTRFTQVFQNLLSNAVKFNDKTEGIIVIGGKYLENSDYEFFIEDNGIGIPEDQVDDLFKVFKTLHKSPENTGLGLAIVKKIIYYYGGSIKIESQEHIKTKILFSISGKYIIS